MEGNSTNKSIYAFSFLVGKHREPQSINAKLFLPIIPIGIVAYALNALVGLTFVETAVSVRYTNGSKNVLKLNMQWRRSISNGNTKI